MTLLTDEPDRFERALAVLEGSFDISEAAGPTTPARSSSTG